MVCPKCGSTIPDSSNFCTCCGNRMIPPKVSTIQLRCKQCGGFMDVEADRPVLFCQFCGSKELINESDPVAVQRIKSTTYKQIALEQLQFEREKEQAKNQREEAERKQNEYRQQKFEIAARREEFLASSWKNIVIILFVICTIIAFTGFIKGKSPVIGIITSVQAVLFGVSWLKGMQILKEKRPHGHKVYAIIGLLLIIPFMKSWSEKLNEPTYFEWPSSGMCTMLPTPNSTMGKLSIFPESIDLSLDQCSDDDYTKYVASCTEMGFNVETDQDNTHYMAYNDEEYRVNIVYNSSGKTINVHLNSPRRFIWPSSGMCTKLPTPSSDMGELRILSDSINLNLDQCSNEDYTNYVESCIERGFNIEIDQDNTHYVAYNDEGYKIDTAYNSSTKIINIHLDSPIQMQEILWPKTKICKMLPAPESHIGKIETDEADSFSAYIGDTPRENFENYIIACQKKGFTIDYVKQADSFSGMNKQEYEVNVRYVGFKTMYISIYAP